jgi:hypothetical protein
MMGLSGAGFSLRRGWFCSAGVSPAVFSYRNAGQKTAGGTPALQGPTPQAEQAAEKPTISVIPSEARNLLFFVFL